MKRLMIILFAIGMTTMSSTSMAAMSKSKVRKEARFLTDKMAYELDLSVGQRNDTYEINYDFIYSVRDLMDDVLRGEEWAMNRYYYLLDLRNDDLRWVLSDYQYRRFIQVDYFYRPIYASGNKWSFRIYITYSNHNHFFFDRPYHYTSYHCNHYRPHNNRVSYYKGRYNHRVYARTPRTSEPKVYNNHRRSDFSSVRIRPNSSKPSQSVSTSRRTSSSGTSSSVNNNSNRRSTSTTSGVSTSTRRTSSATTETSASSSKEWISNKPSSSSSSGSSSNSKSNNKSSVSSSSNKSSRASSSSVRSSSSSSSNRSSSSSGSSSRSSSSGSSSGRSGSRR